MDDFLIEQLFDRSWPEGKIRFSGCSYSLELGNSRTISSLNSSKRRVTKLTQFSHFTKALALIKAGIFKLCVPATCSGGLSNV